MAFTLVEVMAAFVVIGIMVVALFTAFSSGFNLVQVTREDQRATQLLLEKMEVVRLYNWDQITSPTFIPTNFVAPFYATNTELTGLLYTGAVTIAEAPISESYSNDMRLVTVSVGWTSSDGRSHQRQISTFVSRYGLQNYIY